MWKLSTYFYHSVGFTTYLSLQYTHTHIYIYIYIYIYLTNKSMRLSSSFIGCIRGARVKFPDFFSMGTFIDSTHMKIWSPSNLSPPDAMNLLYRFNNFWKAP